jgi:hypothetical protein
MIRTFYHTVRRSRITAEVIDLGTKAPVEVDDLDLLFERPIGSPEPPKKPCEPRTHTAGIIAAAAKEEPGTVYQLAERTGFAVTTVQHIVQKQPFVFIGLVAGRRKGQKRRIYGVMV